MLSLHGDFPRWSHVNTVKLVSKEESVRRVYARRPCGRPAQSARVCPGLANRRHFFMYNDHDNNNNGNANAATAARRRRRSHWSPPPPPPPRAMSDSSSGTIAHRKYVDPWDLDLREVSWRHSSDTTDCSADQVVSLSSAAGPESTRSDFVYVPGPPPLKNKSSGSGGRTRARSAARYECCQCSPKSSLALLPPDPMDTYECWEPGCKRRQPRPPPPPPPPPPYRYAADDRFYPAAVGQPTNQCRLLYNASRPEVRRNSRYNNSDTGSAAYRAYETSSGEYDLTENVIITSQFGYNTLGHMKIDYSSNWNNLDKYICQV